jgi:asparagine synthase (glutamine-hydrolysing)
MQEKLNVYCEVFEKQLLNTLSNFILRNPCDCIALSGGIDTTLIAVIAKLGGVSIRGVYTFFNGGIPRDLVYVNHISKTLSIPVTMVIIDVNYIRSVLGNVYECIGKKAYHELCIELRNDVVFYATLRVAKEHGCKCVYVGSGGDELFAGYSFMLWLLEEELEKYREKWGLGGRYPELEIASCLGVDVVAPYLSKEVKELALSIPAKCLRGELFEGKKLLRNLISKFGLDLISERIKTPAEAGAGTDSICLTP